MQYLCIRPKKILTINLLLSDLRIYLLKEPTKLIYKNEHDDPLNPFNLTYNC